VLTPDGKVDNDRTLEAYAEMARAQAHAGVDMVGPSGMMDGQVAAIRCALDGAAHTETPILAYAAKYASGFYGPFREAAEAGISGLMLFGIPGEKDPVGSQADAADGIVNVALQQLKDDLGDELVLMADLCLCEYTDHGHCGIVTPAGLVDNDPTLDRYAAVAIAQAQAGAHVIAPSGMMDGQVAAIRRALDGSGFSETPILAYAAKYASGFYGPFREAAEGAPQFGDRSTYQMDPPNADEALREVRQDLAEGADAVMVKPALPYLDIVRAVADSVDVPVSAYQVSGEYAMLEAAAANGWVDRQRAILETLTAIRRAGAGTVLTYWAVEAAQWLTRGPAPR
jgi:porphobilinogen synthase